MHLLEPVADQLEGFAEALLQCRVQLFIDRPPHFFELVRIVGLYCGQPRFNGHFQTFEALVQTEREAVQLARESLQPFGLCGAELNDLRGQRLAEQSRRLRPFLTITEGLFARLAPTACQFLAQFALQAHESLFLRLLLRPEAFFILPPVATQQQRHLEKNDHHHTDNQRQSHRFTHQRLTLKKNRPG